MRTKIRNPKDFYAGLIFIAFGAIGALLGPRYGLGTAARMGPGYFPTALGIILVLMGFAVSLRSLKQMGEPIARWQARPLLLVTSAVVAFAFLLGPLGLVAAILALVLIAALAGGEFRPREVALLYLALTMLAVGLFVYGLGLPFRLWPL
jgi:hypothetical protein